MKVHNNNNNNNNNINNNNNNNNNNTSITINDIQGGSLKSPNHGFQEGPLTGSRWGQPIGVKRPKI